MNATKIFIFVKNSGRRTTGGYFAKSHFAKGVRAEPQGQHPRGYRHQGTFWPGSGISRPSESEIVFSDMR